MALQKSKGRENYGVMIWAKKENEIGIERKEGG